MTSGCCRLTLLGNESWFCLMRSKPDKHDMINSKSILVIFQYYTFVQISVKSTETWKPQFILSNIKHYKYNNGCRKRNHTVKKSFNGAYKEDLCRFWLVWHEYVKSDTKVFSILSRRKKNAECLDAVQNYPLYKCWHMSNMILLI